MRLSTLSVCTFLFANQLSKHGLHQSCWHSPHSLQEEKKKKKGTSQRRKLTGVRKEKAKHYYKSCWYPFFYIFFTKNIFSNVFLIFFLKLFWYQCIYKVTERWRTRSSVLLFSLFFCSQAWLKTWKLHSSTTEDLRKERQMCGLVSFCLLICYIIVTCLFE